MVLALKKGPNSGAHDSSLENLFRSAEVYREYVRSNSLLSFEMFLLIASRAPIMSWQIAELLRVPQGTVSGGLRNLGEGSPKFRRPADAPHGLISVFEHPEDARMKLITPTQRGSELVLKMRAAMGNRQ